tara:strand:- start:1834 stop:3342 length:1509 start_codon:yes stop_codon:yes gene_type:complete
MKPLNYDSEGCDPISSNCVIWQGPDIACIDLCKGDTVSNVVYKLALELCSILDKLNVSAYDLSCFDLLECAPETFEALIQLLINRICALESGTIPSTASVEGCPDCVVNICSEFYYTSPQGDTITTMQLKDYVIAIGNRVCNIIGEISTINSTLTVIDGRVTQNATDILNLQNATVTLPPVTPVCVLPATTGPQSLVDVLTALEAAYCSLETATGTTNELYTSFLAQCLLLNDSPQLSGSGNMSGIAGWEPIVSNAADSINNLWLTICDMRAAILNIQANCCDTDCSAVIIVMTPTLTSPTELSISFLGSSVPVGYTDCSPSSEFIISDVVGGGPLVIPGINFIQQYVQTSQPYVIPLAGTAINGAYSVNVQLNYCAQNVAEGTTCNGIVQSVALAAAECPGLTITPGFTDVSATGSWTAAVPATLTWELWNGSQTVLVSSSVQNITALGSIGVTFNSLIDNTLYYVRVLVNGIPCEFYPINTLEYTCLAPAITSVSVDYGV